MKTFLTTTKEPTARQFAETRQSGPPTPRLRHADAKEPWYGATRQRVDRVVQWMTDTERAILLYDFGADCHFWLPRWLWPSNALATMAGEAAPVALPRYFIQRLGLS